MTALWYTLLRIFWTIRPVMALEANLARVIELGFSLFTGDDLDDHSRDPEWRARMAAAMFDAHRKLDLLIYHRACELAGKTTRLGFRPDYSYTPGSTDLVAIWRAFERLVAKFDDYERYARLRAERLKREDNDYPLRLAATLQSTSPALCAVEANRRRLASLGAQHWGRWHARPCAHDGRGRAFTRGSAFARGPPLVTRLPIADCPSPQKRQLLTSHPHANA